MGFVNPPLHRQSIAFTPVQAPRGLVFGSKLPSFKRVPPLPFLPASTVYSTMDRAGLLHPAAGPGVRQVLGSLRRPEGRLSTPAPLARTLRSFPLPGSLPASPRSVPSRRWAAFRLPVLPLTGF